MAHLLKIGAQASLAAALLGAGAAGFAAGDTLVHFHNGSGEKVRITIMPDQIRKAHADNVAIRNPKTGKRIVEAFGDDLVRILPPRTAWIQDGESIAFSYKFEGSFHTFFDLDFSIQRDGSSAQAQFRYCVARDFHDEDTGILEDSAAIVPLVAGKPGPAPGSLAGTGPGAAGQGNPRYVFKGFLKPPATRVRQPAVAEDAGDWGELLAIAGLSPLPAEPPGPGAGTPPRRLDFTDCLADSPQVGEAKQHHGR